MKIIVWMLFVLVAGVILGVLGKYGDSGMAVIFGILLICYALWNIAGIVLMSLYKAFRKVPLS